MTRQVTSVKLNKTAAKLNKLNKEDEMLNYHWTWTDKQLPVMRPQTEGGMEALKEVTLIVAMFDHDTFNAHDPLGCALVPLRPPPDARHGEHGSSWDFSTPLSWERGIGHFRCTVNLATGRQVKPALAKAAAEGAGRQATTHSKAMNRAYACMQHASCDAQCGPVHVQCLVQ